MFAPYAIATWEAATIIAIISGLVGFFVVLRQSTFVAHALPTGAFAGAGAAALVGVSSLIGLGVFSLLSAFLMTALRRRSTKDTATALAMVFLLGLGALFLSQSGAYASSVYGLLFGQLLGVSRSEIPIIAAVAVIIVVVTLAIYRPLLRSSILPELTGAQAISEPVLEMVFLILVAAVTAVALPIVGALLVFSLLTAPPAAARALTSRPHLATVLSSVIALGIVWVSIALGFTTNLPVGFFVGSLGALVFVASRFMGPTRLRPARLLARRTRLDRTPT
ncbi:MAG: metal ABC transporter permease [Acidimicrobiales bacterium]